MPIILEYKDDAIEYIVWRLTEDIEQLKAFYDCDNIDQLNSFKLDKRKKEFICSRISLTKLFSKCINIEYDEFRKPYIKGSSWEISISHSGEYIAVARSNYKLGIDIEKITEKLNRTKHKFSSEKELSNINNENNLLTLGIHWSAKESVYKLVGNENLIFDTDMQIDKFTQVDNGEIRLRLNCKQYNIDLDVKYKKIGDYILTYCTKI